MDFTIEETNSGRPCIVYNECKYRQQRVLKSGDIWRCLTGKSCGAFVKTDTRMTSIISINDKHTGPHAATMRQMRSPCSVQPLASPTLSTVVCSTPSPSTSPQSIAPAASPVHTTPITLVHEQEDITKENLLLKHEIAQLNQQLQAVLDHSIESDTRLMQYTDEIFAVNNTPTSAPSGVKQKASTPATTDWGVQCDIKGPHTSVDSSLQCDILSARTGIECQENKEIILRPKTTIEVLEADIYCLRRQLNNCRCSDESSWTRVKNKKEQPSLKVSNRFEVLNNYNERPILSTKPNQTLLNYSNKKQSSKKNITKNVTKHIQNKTKTGFKTIQIKGDSHARHIAGLVGSLIDSATFVSGVCKPGAKLTDIVSSQPTTTSPETHCEVLLAGTNDLAAGEERNIYQHLEKYITSFPANTKVVLATLPHRHDLKDPLDPIHRRTDLVNAFTEELAVRHGATVLDLGRISRKMFTNHGQHLNIHGKRRLAQLVVDCISVDKTMPSASEDQRAPTLPPLIQQPASRTIQPISLQYDTFADAVKLHSPPSHNQICKGQTNKNNHLVKNNFLGTPLLNTGLN